MSIIYISVVAFYKLINAYIYFCIIFCCNCHGILHYSLSLLFIFFLLLAVFVLCTFQYDIAMVVYNVYKYFSPHIFILWKND